jgi:hypothetical protein
MINSENARLIKVINIDMIIFNYLFLKRGKRFKEFYIVKCFKIFKRS